MPEQKRDWWQSVDASAGLSPQIDLAKPSIARVYDYLLGGKDNFASDREVGDHIREALPAVFAGVQEQREALKRVVRYLVADAGIRQLIDIGSGLPTAGNVHEVAYEASSDVRVVYVDNDPIVLAHARALLNGDPSTAVLEGDLLRPEEILQAEELRSFIDYDRPVALLFCGILHYIRDEEDPWAIVETFRAALAPGSYAFIHHLVDESVDPDVAQAQAVMRRGLGRGEFRTASEVRRFFDGLTMIEPGLVPVTEWRPDAETPPTASNPVFRLGYGGVARKD